jgi:glycerol-3-phosphate acyltransferase PlsY
MTQLYLTTLVVIVISYALGCFSTAYYLVRWRTGKDIRQMGSGTAGARNVGRVLGKTGFAITFLGDATKGALAVGLARWLDLPSFGLMAAFIAVVAGHLWPVQLGGKGGKGVSTAYGGVLVLNLYLGLIILGIVLISLLITRSFTRAGMIAMALAPFAAWLMGLDWVLVGGIAIVALILLFAHRGNWVESSVSRQATANPSIPPNH